MSKLQRCTNTNEQDTQDVDVHAAAVAAIHEDCDTENDIDAGCCGIKHACAALPSPKQGDLEAYSWQQNCQGDYGRTY
jgi:hypothetical protein